MPSPAGDSSMIRFGAFELDAANGELRKAGVSLKIHPQPLQVLLLLAEHAGQTVTRNEIQRCLWGDNTCVDFERGINFCVNQIRATLGDDAEKPLYVETLPRRGYRFIAPVNIDAALTASAVGERISARSTDESFPSLAVLPFENLSGDLAQDYFAEGMTETLITELGKISALRVISRQSMMQYKGTKKTVPQIAGEPGQVTGSDIAAATRIAEQLAVDRGGFYVDQFNAPEGKAAHEAGTTRELLDTACGGIDGWTACVGTGCTFLGVARALRRANPSVMCGAVEPAGCQVLAGQAVTKAKHLLQGAGYGSVPPMWEPGLMSHSVAVSDEEATTWKKRLAIEEGLHVGFTAAANVCAAIKMLSSGVLAPNATVATVLCDTGLKY